ncbi:MAG: hypothetical protein MUC38_00750 [Cyclobacteriaceae bacterium]|nr:hypothetical protein [Cyclobacteriaceae bacterium]
MYAFRFWKLWPTDQQRWLAVLAALFLVATAYVWYAYDRQPAPVIKPEQLEQRVLLPVVTGQLSVGGFSLPEPADNYLIYESVQGSLFNPNRPAAYVFVALMLACLVVMATVISALPRFWFLLGFAVWVVCWVSLRVPAFGLFGLANQVPLVGIVCVYSIALVYFHWVGREAQWTVRFLVFSVVTVGVVVTLFFFASVPDPLGLLAVRLVPSVLLMALLVILLSAHEIMAGFVWIIGQGRPQKSLRHFLIGAVVYLLNVFLLYADSIYLIRWNIDPLFVYLLLTATMVVGVWGFRRQHPTYESIFSPDPAATYFYVALVTAVTSSLAFFMATHNDPLLQLARQIILFGHLGFGIIFFLYMAINFVPLLGDNVAVYKVLYKPKVMPFVTFRIGATIATVAFFVYAVWTSSVYRATSGYLLGLADWHLSNGQVEAAQEELENAARYKKYTHHGNYVLANIHTVNQRWTEAIEAYGYAAMAGDDAWAYINQSSLQLQQGKPLDALETLHKARKRFPQDGAVRLALGSTHAHINSADSAFYYFAQANTTQVASAAETNFLATAAQVRVAVPADSLLLATQTNSEGALANAFALANRQQRELTLPLRLPADTVLSLYTSVRLVNQLINQLHRLDTGTLKAVTTLARRPSNQFFEPSLLMAAAHGYYRLGLARDAVSLIQELNFKARRPEYAYLLALWHAHAGNWEGSRGYAAEAGREGEVIKAIALIEQGRRADALTLWDSLATSTDAAVATLARETADVLRATVGSPAWSDRQQILFATYKTPTEAAFEQALSSIREPQAKAAVTVDRAKRLWAAGHEAASRACMNRLNEWPVPASSLRTDIILFSLVQFVKAQQWVAVQQQLKALGPTHPWRAEYQYALAALAQQEGNARAAADHYRFVAAHGPFLEDAIVAGAEFFAAADATSLEPLSILTEGLLAKPESIKVLKAYTLQAARLGYAEEAQQTLNTLGELLPVAELRQFVQAHPALLGE